MAAAEDLRTVIDIVMERSPVVEEVLRHDYDFRILDVAVVRRLHGEMAEAFPFADIHAAVKASSAEVVLETLHECGSSFEVAGGEEIKMCMSRGIHPAKLMYSHPAKSAKDVRMAHELGIRRYVSDSKDDLEQLARLSPGAEVLIRIRTENVSKDGDPLTGFDSRFGVNPEEAKELLKFARDRGLKPVGIAFHIGTQEENVGAWERPIGVAAGIMAEMAREEHMNLTVLDVGGGFPSRHNDDIPTFAEYGAAVKKSLERHLGPDFDKSFEIIIEPGRALSAMAGFTVGQVINVKPDPAEDGKSIATVTIGRFSAGLYGVGHDVMFYRKSTDGAGGRPGEYYRIPDSDTSSAGFYGRACAAFDTPVDPGPVPADLQTGDVIVVTGTGAYTGEMQTNWCQMRRPADLILDSDSGEQEMILKHPRHGKVLGDQISEPGPGWVNPDTKADLQQITAQRIKIGMMAGHYPNVMIVSFRDERVADRFYEEAAKFMYGKRHPGRAATDNAGSLVLEMYFQGKGSAHPDRSGLYRFADRRQVVLSEHGIRDLRGIIGLLRQHGMPAPDATSFQAEVEEFLSERSR